MGIQQMQESNEEPEALELNIMKPEVLAYNFVDNHIHTRETPTAIAIAPPHRLLLCLPTRCIEVRDLKEEKLLFFWRTVNQVTKLIHCLNGDYVAALETKHNQNDDKISYVRIYVNWYQPSSGEEMLHPTNVRIAGQNFPPKASEFEMVEIFGPNPDNIECCQISGNILIQSGKRFTIHEFKMKKLEATALRFVDFEKSPLQVKLSFVPSKIAICENYVAYLNKDGLHAFKIEKKKMKRFAYFKLLEDYKDYKKLLEENMNDVVVHLPGVVARNNSIFVHCAGSYYDQSLTCRIVAELREDTYRIVNFMQVKLKDPYEFRCLVLKPLYVKESLNFENSRHAFPRSTFREHLGGVACFVSTAQKGFFFQFSDSEDTCECVSVYSFSEPVSDVILGSSLIHALTKNGLESYTVQNKQKLFRILKEASQDFQTDDSVMLLGHHAASGFERLLECDDGLVLLENNEAFLTDWVILNWKFLHLEFPVIDAIFPDASSRESNLRVMKEIHTMLHLSTMLAKWILDEDNLVRAAPPDCGLIESYQKICALLGDYFIVTPNYELSIPYYKMGSISPHEVLQRFKILQAQNGDCSEDGMVHYLTVALSEDEFEENQDFLQEIETVFEKHSNVEVAPLILKNKMLQKSTGKLINILCYQSFSDMRKETERLLALTLLYFQNGNDMQAETELSYVANDTILHQILEECWKTLFQFTGSFSKLCLTLLVSKPEVVTKVVTHVMFHDEANSNGIIQALQEFDKMEKTRVNATQKTLELYLKTLFKNKNSEDVATMVSEGSLILLEVTKSLIDSYWAKLKTSNEDESEMILPCPKRPFLFEDLRFNYLNSVPPLKTVETDLVVLKKMEAIFCSPLVLLLDVDAFVEVNNYPSLKSILLNPEESLSFLLETYPECLLQFGKDRFVNHQQWKVLVSQIRMKSVSLNSSADCEIPLQLYKTLLDKTLRHLARTMELDDFEEVISGQNQDRLECYETYVTLCRNHMRANEMQELIKTTAKEVLLGFKIQIA